MKQFFAVLTLGLLAITSPSQSAEQFDIARYGFQTTFYQGKFKLKPDRETLEGVGLPVDKLGAAAKDLLFTTTINLDPRTQYVVPDLLYAVKTGDAPDSLGLRLLPIKQQDWDDHGHRLPLTEAPTAQLDAFLRQIFYGDRESEKQIYAFAPHSESSDAYYDNFANMAAAKVETSTGHVSAYVGSGKNSRRDMLDRGTVDNIFTVSLKGVPQEAVNKNIAIWTRMYYDDPDGYQFSEDYHFDWVVNSNLEETLAFGKGWLKRDWIRRDINQKVMAKIAEFQIQKDAPFKQTTPYYEMLKEQNVLGIYCFEGVANTINLGLSVPLTRVALKKIYGETDGQQIFEAADELYTAVQKKSFNAERTLDGHPLDPATFHPEKLDELEPLLSQLSPLWSLEDGITNPGAYTPMNPLFADRDENSNPVLRVGDNSFQPLSADMGRDQELKVHGKGMTWRPETTSEILRDLLYMYAPYHKVGGARTAALVLSFKAQLIERTGVATSVIKSFGLRVVGEMFKHEANWRLAQIKATSPAEEVEAKFAAYKKATTDALEAVIVDLKHADGIQPGDTALGLDEEELAVLREFRRRRNTAAANEAREIVNTVIVRAMDEAYAAPIENYTTDGYLSFTQFYANVKPILEEINEVPVKEADILTQAVKGERYVKYNNRPGLPMAITHGVHPVNKNIQIKAVATVISEDLLMEQDPQPIDDHAQVLQDFYKNYSTLRPGGRTN